MQQAIYTSTTNSNTANTNLIKTDPIKTATARKARFLRHLALKWDLYGVVALMVSSAAYGVFALAHVA